jgi:heme/copper-type cytochrome/quinol oxidase subunit 1
MPRLTRWHLKTALLYFVAALLVGMLLAGRAVVALPAAVNALSPVYFHLLMVGWVTQLIFGVVFWMFPKQSAARPRGSDALGWAVYWLLNAGLLLRVVAEPWQTLRPAPLPGSALALSAVLQWLAGLAFVANTWPRVKER